MRGRKCEGCVYSVLFNLKIKLFHTSMIQMRKSASVSSIQTNLSNDVSLDCHHTEHQVNY